MEQNRAYVYFEAFGFYLFPCIMPLIQKIIGRNIFFSTSTSNLLFCLSIEPEYVQLLKTIINIALFCVFCFVVAVSCGTKINCPLNGVICFHNQALPPKYLGASCFLYFDINTPDVIYETRERDCIASKIVCFC